MEDVAIDRIVAAVLEADARREPLDAPALTLLLRQYVATGREDVAEAVGRGLAHGLEDDVVRPFEGSSSADTDAAAWLMLFAEAIPVTNDDRLAASAAALANRLRAEWPRRGAVAAAMRSVDACLSAAMILDATHGTPLIPAAVDELERVVGRVYRPGEALAHSLDKPDEDDGELGDHVAAAAALLTAYSVTGRLPYSMLAEELVQFAIGRLACADFFTCCQLARVLCRLAVLLDDDEYRRTAVVAVRSDYTSEAQRVLASASTTYGEHGAAAAIYGLALDEWLRVRRQMQ
jgi:hypothetical protein